jgi:hypothetical protein
MTAANLNYFGAKAQEHRDERVIRLQSIETYCKRGFKSGNYDHCLPQRSGISG